MKAMWFMILGGLISVSITYWIGAHYFEDVVTRQSYKKAIDYDKRQNIIKKNRIQLKILSVIRIKKNLEVNLELSSTNTNLITDIIVFLYRPGSGHSNKGTIEIFPKDKPTNKKVFFREVGSGYRVIEVSFRLKGEKGFPFSIQKSLYIN